jgi:very-short-patch-repair endonuclease
VVFLAYANETCFRFWHFVTRRGGVRPIDIVLMTAAEQRGAVSVTQMRECGLTARAQRAAVAKRQLRMVEPGVAVVAGSPDSWFQRLQIGLLALGPEAWVSHEAAAALLEFDKCLFEPLAFTKPRGVRTTTNVGAVHTTACIGPLDVITVNGFRCSSATRTVIDLAYIGVPPHRLAAAIDSAVRSRMSAVPVIERRLGEVRGRGRRGVRVLDRLMPDSGGETPLERAFLTILRRNRLPRPTTQFRVVGKNGLIGRVDFHFEALGIVVEVTGRKGHASDWERQCDAQRRNELTDQGLKVYEYTRGQVDDRAEWVAATMRERLTAAGWVP